MTTWAERHPIIAALLTVGGAGILVVLLFISVYLLIASGAEILSGFMDMVKQ